LDEIRLYGRALTSTDARALYLFPSGTAPSPCAGPVPGPTPALVFDSLVGVQLQPSSTNVAAWTSTDGSIALTPIATAPQWAAWGSSRAVRFSGNSTLMSSPINHSWFSSATAFTAIAAFQTDGSAASRFTLFSHVIGLGPEGQRVMLHTTYTDQLTFQFGKPFTNCISNASQISGGYYGRAHIASLQANGSVESMRLDSIFLRSVSAQPLSDASPANLFIGGDVFGNTFTGSVGTIRFYNTVLSPSDVLAIETDLACRYAVPVPTASPTGEKAPPVIEYSSAKANNLSTNV
jgi:hypothetical protein